MGNNSAMNNDAADAAPNRFLTSTTGIPWLDDALGSMPPPVLMDGGLARGRTIAIVGKAGTGKTMLAMQLLVATAGNGRQGLMLLGEETLSVAVERMNELRTVQALREAWLAKCLSGDVHPSAVDYIDILSSHDDPDRVLSILRAIKARVVVLDLTSRLVHPDDPRNFGFVRKCWEAVDRTTTLIFTGNSAELEHHADVVMALHEREVANGVTGVRLSIKKFRFTPMPPKGFVQLEVRHNVTVHHTPGTMPIVEESRSLVQAE